MCDVVILVDPKHYKLFMDGGIVVVPPATTRHSLFVPCGRPVRSGPGMSTTGKGSESPPASGRRSTKRAATDGKKSEATPAAKRAPLSPLASAAPLSPAALETVPFDRRSQAHTADVVKSDEKVNEVKAAEEGAAAVAPPQVDPATANFPEGVSIHPLALNKPFKQWPRRTIVYIVLYKLVLSSRRADAKSIQQAAKELTGRRVANLPRAARELVGYHKDAVVKRSSWRGRGWWLKDNYLYCINEHAMLVRVAEFDGATAGESHA